MRIRLNEPLKIGDIMKQTFPKDIDKILKKLSDKRDNPKNILEEEEFIKLETFLQTLEEAFINPHNNKQCFVNPIPKEPDLTITREETMIDRIRHINSVSARVREMEGSMSKQELEEFESVDLDSIDDHPIHRSVFQVADHEIIMEEDKLEPIHLSKKSVPNPDLESEADVIPPEADNAGAQE